MPYHSDKIASLIHRLNTVYFLPAIQREFVWHPEQVIQLFDSLLRGYPISTFLFWELVEKNRNKWEIYRFIEHYRQGETHNERASTQGLQQLILVLDGQQRLTSLLIGLKGSYTLKAKWKRWDDPTAWSRQHLYLDLLKDSRQESEDGSAGIRHGLKFMSKAPDNSAQHHWFRVGRILDCKDDDQLEDLKEAEQKKLHPDARSLLFTLNRNLNALHKAIWKEAAISYYIETSEDYDRVLDIFIRANEGGTKLSKSDLLLSTVTAQWDDVNAREEIFGFVDRLNCQLARKNDLDKDFVMKSCLMLTDLPVQYKVDNFNSHNLQLIQNRWPDIKHAIERSVNLINSFGIDRDTLTSANALIPISYYLFQHPGISLLGSSQFDVSNAAAIRRWLLAVLLNGVFGGQSDRVLTDVRRILKGSSENRDFPVKALLANSLKLADAGIESAVLSTGYGRQTTFLALSLLYDDNNWGVKPFHQDHIFPRAFFTTRRLLQAGIPESRHQRYQTFVNRIGNLQLLLAHENLEKSAKPFEEWLTTRDASFKARHLIPDNPSLYQLERFEEFIQARELLIAQRLNLLFPNERVLTILPGNRSEAHARLVERIRLAPGREWVSEYFDLLNELIEFSGLIYGDPRLVLSIPKYKKLPVTINQRYALAPYWKGKVLFGFILGAEAMSALTPGRYESYFRFQPRNGEVESETPFFVRVAGSPREVLVGELKEQWKQAVLYEVEQGIRSSFCRFHEPVVYQAATDLHYRNQLLDEAFALW